MSLALHAIESRRRPIGYTMPAKEYGNSAELLGAARSLNGRMRPAELVRVSLPAAPVPAAPEPVPFVRKPHDYLFVQYAPYKRRGPRWLTVTADYLIAEVCSQHEITLNEIKGKSRSQKAIWARYEAYHRLRQELGYSLPMIGRCMGGKDHSGVLHGIRRYKERAGKAQDRAGL